MNAERLLAHFEQISEAPDAIARLRRFILDLAVRGKLVEQDPEDEPVEGYLELIKAQPIDQGDFGTPCHWAWVSVGEVSSSRLGKMLDKAKNKGTERPYLRNINVRWLDFDLSDLLEMRFEESELSEYELKKGDVLICEGGEPGRAAVWDDRARGVYFQKAIHRVRFDECVDPFFFVQVLRCSALDERLSRYFTGTGISHFTGKSLKGYLFPLPPLAEQHRIVAKVDELMARCDQLEAARQQREQGRERLMAATLQRLNQPAEDPASFRQDASFALQVLPSLTTTPALIKQLRQTILNLAVRGKLVEQEKSAEEQCKLFEGLKADQLLAFRAGSIRQKVAALSSLPGEISLSEPVYTSIVNLASIIVFGPQNGISPPEVADPSAPKALTLSATTSGAFCAKYFKHVNIAPEACEPYWLSSGDLLFQRGNTREYVGMAAVYDGPERSFVYPDLMIRVQVSKHVSLRYVHMVLVSPDLRAYLTGNASGSSQTMPKINQDVLLNAPIPLPPLAEQHRIVAKVDELMALCDQLEQQLSQADQQRRRLLEAVLAEALGGRLPTEEEIHATVA